MKILIVDDNAKIRCEGIIKECEKRAIEIEIAKASKQAMFIIYSDKEEMIDGIILDMNLPIYPECEIKRKEGEEVLRRLLISKINIPVLLFSKEQKEEKYDQVFGQMRDWNEEKDKFFAFLEKTQEEREEKERLKKEKLEELEKLKEKERLK